MKRINGCFISAAPMEKSTRKFVVVWALLRLPLRSPNHLLCILYGHICRRRVHTVRRLDERNKMWLEWNCHQTHIDTHTAQSSQTFVLYRCHSAVAMYSQETGHLNVWPRPYTNIWSASKTAIRLFANNEPSVRQRNVRRQWRWRQQCDIGMVTWKRIQCCM